MIPFGWIISVCVLLLSTSMVTPAQSFEEIQKERLEKNEYFKDKEKSPLEKKYIRKFKGLKYFPYDSAFVVTAWFVANENPVEFKMQTTTSRLPSYVKYGELHFLMKGVEYKLDVLQSPEVSKRPGLENYLFLPFTDETTGNESYDVGRYLDLTGPLEGTLTLDFNRCYNPSCAYSNRFSCPIPPRGNHLPIRIEAGEKRYFDEAHH